MMRQVLTMSKSAPKKSGEGMSRSARRRRNRNKAVRDDLSYSVNLTSPGVITSKQLVQRKTRGNFTNFPIGRMTASGETFLRAVFAAPDFQTQGGYDGIPDEATHSCVPYRHLYQSKLDTSELVDAGDNDHSLVIVQLPVPGVAYYTAVIDNTVGFAPETILHPVLFDDSNELFPGVGQNSDMIQGFRECGRAIELVCTSNSLNWSGNIKAFKANLKLTDCSAYTPVSGGKPCTKQLVGLETINATSQPSYIGSANMGVYMVSGRLNSSFTVCSTIDDVEGLNGSNPTARGVIDGPFTGYGDLEANIIVLSDQIHADITGQGICNTFFVRAWAITEYLPSANSVIARTARTSPAYDPVAMRAYERILKDMPVAVSYFENAKFWDTVKKILGGVFSGLSKVPGPVGGIATGANAIYQGVNELLA